MFKQYDNIGETVQYVTQKNNSIIWSNHHLPDVAVEAVSSASQELTVGMDILDVSVAVACRG